MRILSAFLLLCFFCLLSPLLVCADPSGWDDTAKEMTCPSPDEDCDGYATDGTGKRTGTDCDDTVGSGRSIYPGIYTTGGCTSGEYRQCGTDGTYSNCTSGDLCESTGSGVCYYVDAGSGSNSNNGLSIANAFATLECISKYDGAGAPACNVDPMPCGSVVYIFDGTYNETVANSQGSVNGLVLEGPDCDGSDRIKVVSYPGESAVVIEEVKLLEQGMDNFVFGGQDYPIELTSTTDTCFQCQNCDNMTLRNLYIHDCDGSGNNSGIRLDSVDNTEIYNVRLHDNYDRSSPGNQNNANIQIFQGRGITINQAIIYNDDRNVSGIKWKHGASSPDAGNEHEINSNFVWDCHQFGTSVCIGGGLANANYRYNYVETSVGVAAFDFDDLGGTQNTGNYVIEYNTFAGAGSSLMRIDYTSADGTDGGGLVQKNVFTSTDSSITEAIDLGDNSTSDTDYTNIHTGGLWTIDENCYYFPNDGTPQWNLFSGTPSGSLRTFAQWQSDGYDSNSHVENVQLDSFDRATSTNCDTYGYALSTGTPVTTTTTTTTTTSTTIDPGSSTFEHWDARDRRH